MLCVCSSGSSGDVGAPGLAGPPGPVGPKGKVMCSQAKRETAVQCVKMTLVADK